MKTEQVALVTGANRGIGYAVAKALIQHRIQVIATSRNVDNAKKAQKELSQYGSITFHQLDVTDFESIMRLYASIKTNFGKLDILINNAGVNYDTWHNAGNANLREVRTTFETNFFGPWQLAQTLLPLMKNSELARIVNVSSGSGTLASQNGETPGYSLSKLALNGLTMHLANAFRGETIIVNSVGPGWVKTDMGGKEAPRTPEQGAETIVWAAMLTDRKNTGKFFRDKTEINW